MLVVNDFYTTNREYYNRNANRYEKASWYYFNKYKNAMVAEELFYCVKKISSRSLKVLEIGPGTGYLLGKLLNTKGIEIDYTGIEHSHQMIEIIKKRFSSKIKNLNLINETITPEIIINLQLSNDYDLIIGSSILHHLLDYKKVVSVLSKLLKVNGVMYFVREPIHKNDCVRPEPSANFINKFYEKLNYLLMKPWFINYFYPEKVKAEDAREIAYHMFKEGVSMEIFYELEKKGMKILLNRKYNRRLSSFLSYLENKWLADYRKDIFGNTLYSICLQKV